MSCIDKAGIINSCDYRARDKRAEKEFFRILLGSPLHAIAQQLAVSERTICLLRHRYQQEAVSVLISRGRSGRPRTITRAKEFAVVTATSRQPPAATPRSARRLAIDMGVSLMTVHRISRKHGCSPIESRLSSLLPTGGRQQIVRHRRVLPGPARACVGAVYGREEPDSSARPHSTFAAAQMLHPRPDDP